MVSSSKSAMLLLMLGGSLAFQPVVKQQRRVAPCPAARSVEEAMAQSCGAATSVGAASAALRLKVADLLDDAAVVSKLPYSDGGEDAWLVRFLVESEEVDLDAVERRLRESVEWRQSAEGAPIVEAALRGVEDAMGDGKWNNEPVLSGAPHSAAISPYVTPAKLLTMPNTAGDGLVYAIRAGVIDDKSLMKKVSVEELAEFFLYAKAVNERVCALITARTGKLATVITLNDLGGVDLFGDASFRKALSAASKKADAIFPGLAGPTILLNLPTILGALVKLFKPLFPPAVQAKLKFETFAIGPPEDMVDPSKPARKELLDFIEGLA